jgi:hypothetical protein
MATGVLQVRVMEGGEGVAESLQEDDVVLMVPLIGRGGSVSMGRREAERRRRERARRCCGLTVLVKENGIGSLGELQWIVGVLIALRIEDGKQ